MRLALARGRRLLPARRDRAAFRTSRLVALSLARRKERLYRAIGRTQAFMHKRVSPVAVMETIRRRYPAPGYFVESNRRALERAGVQRLDAFYYAMIPALTRTCLSQQWGLHPRLDSLAAMRPFLKTLYIGRHVECFYLILLDGRGRLIRPALMQRGNEEFAPFYLGQVLNTALQDRARYVVLAHNHPRGTPHPSREDVQCTLRAINALAPLRIAMLDHLIVAGNNVVSIRQAGLVPDVLWTAVAPGNRIARNWIGTEI